jgi:sterol desaturase/sphingolipid hydroxylase (fatty acid hydroxylase superfamily)
MDLEKAFPIILTTLFVGFIVLEAVRPARPLPKVRGWRLQGVVAFFVTGAVSASVPLLYIDFVRAHRLMNLEWLGTWGGAVVAFLAGELLGYWVHRASHGTLLWRAYHQVHHSAERVDVFGSAFFHPLEIAVGGFVGTVITTMLLGVSPQAAALAALVGIAISIFQHANVRTPRVLGYFVQRPEAHSVHHRRGAHTKNYSRLPFVDMIFGTFENPEYFDTEAGFYPGASKRVLEMLVGIDVAASARRPTDGESQRTLAPATQPHN